MSHLRRLFRCGLAAVAAFFFVASTSFAQSAVADTEASSSKLLAGSLAKLRTHAQEIVHAIPMVPSYVSDAVTAFHTAAGGIGAGRFLLGALGCLLAGIAAELVVRRASSGMRMRRSPRVLATVRDRLTMIGIEAVLEAGAVLAFAVGMLVVLMIEEWPGGIHEVGIAFLVAVLWVRAAFSFLTLLLRPLEGPQRELAAFDLTVPEARFWLRHLIAFVAWFAFGWAAIATLRVLGMPRPGLMLVAYAMGIGLLVIALLVLWRQPARPTANPAAARKAGRWAASFGLFAIWAIWAAGAMPVFWFLVVAILMPLAISAGKRASRHLMRPVAGADVVAGRASVAEVFLEQGLRAAAIVGGIMILLWGWGLDVGSLAAQENAFTRLLRGGLHALIIILVADLAWSLMKAMADTTLANAQVADGLSPEEARRRARIRTLLPIGRNVAFIVLVVMAGLMALAALGVEIGPLVASAGVVGVAVGFGCQTVVRDIISGMFYMVDDAFRVGEYIQSGNYKGVVESFSLRSVKLRHQRGPLFTIPFGSLGAVQNMSRDWVMVKDQIGITHDSDVEKAKKLIKQIGQELAKDPDFGPKILQPLKMQGIEAFGQYGVNIRMKMMTKPGEQFVIRRRANAMIKKSFDDNGIKFAFPTVRLADNAKVDEAALAAASQEVLKQDAAAAPAH